MWATKLFPVRKGGKYGAMNRKGELIIEPCFDSAVYYFREGLAEAEIDGKWGFVDKKYRIKIKPQFEWTWGFSEGLAPVQLNGSWGFIDRSGKIVIEPRFEVTCFFSEGLASVRLKDKKYGFINKKGETVIDYQFDVACSFENGLSLVSIGNKMGYIDKKGKYIWDLCE
jgi:hypothetical protein